MAKTIHELTNELTGFKLIKKRFEELNIGNEEFGEQDIPEKDKILGPWKEVEDGEQQDDDDCTVVLYFIKHGVYIRIDGYYSSYNGSSFEDDYYEVKPEQKTITFTVYNEYKPKKQK